MGASTAILIFTRTVQEEARIKQFLPSSSVHMNRKIANGLIRHARQVALKTMLPSFTITTDQQEGRNFGERLTNAITKVFDKGYQKLIVIGNDAPALKTADLLNAADLLDQYNCVLGPDNRGGTYLIGLNKNSFKPDIFSQLNWQTPIIFEELKNSLLQTGSIIHLEESMADINSSPELLQILKTNNLPATLRKYFKSILASLSEFLLFNAYLFIPSRNCDSCLLRAPPYC